MMRFKVHRVICKFPMRHGFGVLTSPFVPVRVVAVFGAYDCE